MLKKLLLGIVTFIVSMGLAFAQVDANKADQTALDGVRGIGPALSKSILDARRKGGDFKDWTDFQARVKGVAEKSSIKLSQAGLTINGQSKTGAAPVPESKTKAKPAVAPAQAASSDSGEPQAKAGKLVKSAPPTGSDDSESLPKAAKPLKAAHAAGSDSSPLEKGSAKSAAPASAALASQRK